MAEVEENRPVSPIRIFIGKGEDDEGQSIVQHADVPLSVSRPRARPELIVISADADDAGSDGFSMHLNEEMARQLVADLTVVLADPEHRGFVYRPPLD